MKPAQENSIASSPSNHHLLRCLRAKQRKKGLRTSWNSVFVSKEAERVFDEEEGNAGDFFFVDMAAAALEANATALSVHWQVILFAHAKKITGGRPPEIIYQPPEITKASTS